MPLTWNEIRTRAHAFVKEWEDETREHAEAKSFWDAFFDVFGISRRRTASFEEAVKKAGGHQGFIDLSSSSTATRHSRTRCSPPTPRTAGSDSPTGLPSLPSAP